MDIVYYHGGCPDGWCAAYIAKMKYPNATLVPLSYGKVDFERMLLEVQDKEVLMVDFSLKTRAQNDAINGAAKRFLVLDHHKSAAQIIGDANYAIFDMNRSGAGLTFDYLYDADSLYHLELSVYNPTADPCMPPLKRPWWVSYTEDQDLWRFALPNSRAINQYLNVQTRTFEAWLYMLKFLSVGDEKDTLAQVARLGGAIQQYVDYMIAGAMKDVNKGSFKFDGKLYSVGVVNNGHIGTSEIGEAIYNAGYDIALMWREDDNGQIRIGLRSKVADVGAIASLWPGGGGHKASSGFEVSIEDGRKLIDWILERKDGTATHRS